MKEFVKWNKKYSLGLKEIDSQHKKLLDFINEAHELLSMKNNKEEANKLVEELISFVRVHFGTEEKYFREFKYDGAGVHIAEHNRITLKVLRVYDKIKKGDDALLELLTLLREWFDEHCTTYDKDYVKCFKEHGLK